MQTDWTIPNPNLRREEASSSRGSDPVLHPFLAAPDEESARRCLSPLLSTVAEPVIRAALNRRFRRRWLFARKDVESLDDADREEVRGETQTRLLRRLWEIRCSEAEPIADFRAYVAVTVYRVCDQHLATRFPERARLRNRVRALLEDTPGLALWNADHAWMAGFSAWHAERHPPDRRRTLRMVAEDPGLFTREIAPSHSPDQMPPEELLARLLDWAGAPVPLEDLVSAAGALWGVREVDVCSQQKTEEGEAEREAADPSAAVEDVVSLRDLLQALWREIRDLPLPQRVALLLNLRGDPGRDALPLFPLIGVATRCEIAEALEMEPATFAALWDDLPLEDAAIALRLSCTRQQVIGLRDSAKRRLQRRLHALERLPDGRVG